MRWQRVFTICFAVCGVGYFAWCVNGAVSAYETAAAQIRASDDLVDLEFDEPAKQTSNLRNPRPAGTHFIIRVVADQNDQPSIPTSRIANYFRDIHDVKVVGPKDPADVMIMVAAYKPESVTFVNVSAYVFDGSGSANSGLYYSTCGWAGSARLEESCEEFAARVDEALNPIRDKLKSGRAWVDSLPDEPFEQSTTATVKAQ